MWQFDMHLYKFQINFIPWYKILKDLDEYGFLNVD